jgi:hypothetical protein
MEVFEREANGLEAANIEFISENLKPTLGSPIALNFDNIIDVLENTIRLRTWIRSPIHGAFGITCRPEGDVPCQ